MDYILGLLNRRNRSFANREGGWVWQLCQREDKCQCSDRDVLQYNKPRLPACALMTRVYMSIVKPAPTAANKPPEKSAKKLRNAKVSINNEVQRIQGDGVVYVDHDTKH